MSKHEIPEAQYPQPRNEIDSPVPIHDFSSLPAEEITGKALDTVAEYMDTYGKTEEYMTKDDPAWSAALRKLNQVEWELSILPDGDPERGALESYSKASS